MLVLRRTVTVMLAVALLVVTASCGGDDKPVGGPRKVVEVTALDNSFNPETLVIPPGTTVRWTNKGKLQHNSLSVSGEEKIEVEPQNFDPGESFEHTFDKPGTYRYYCSLHGTADAGMIGTIIVSETATSVNTTGPGRPTDTQARQGQILRVPQQYPSIQQAVDAAKSQDMVLIDRGRYREAVKVKTANIVIRGVDRNETILDGGFELDNGFLVSGADGVTIENMTAMNYRVNGFFWTGVQGYRGSYLTAVRNGDYGLYAFDSRHGQFDHSYGAGSPDAGFYIGQCDPCDALITDSLAERNGLGYSGTNSSTLSVLNSTFRFNRAGIVPNSGSYEKMAPEKNTTIIGNTVYGNSRSDVPAIDAALLVQGSGIVSAGGNGNRIERNLVFDHDKGGIVLLAFPEGETVWDVSDNKVKGNVVSDSRRADLAIVVKDKNVGNCFEGNTFTTSAPPNIEKVAPCNAAPSGEFSSAPLVDFIFPNESEVDYRSIPDAPPQTSMPDPETAPWYAAVPATLPTIHIDLDAIAVPAKPAG